MNASSRHRGHAARVAVTAAGVVVACYVAGVIVVNQVLVHRLTSEADGRIAAQLVDAGQLTLRPSSGDGGAAAHPDGDIDDAPIFLWRVLSSGVAQPLTARAPSLPRRQWSARPTTLTVGTTPFRLDAMRFGRDWLVAGQSAAEIPGSRRHSLCRS